MVQGSGARDVDQGGRVVKAGVRASGGPTPASRSRVPSPEGAGAGNKSRLRSPEANTGAGIRSRGPSPKGTKPASRARPASTEVKKGAGAAAKPGGGKSQPPTGVGAPAKNTWSQDMRALSRRAKSKTPVKKGPSKAIAKKDGELPRFMRPTAVSQMRQRSYKERKQYDKKKPNLARMLSRRTRLVTNNNKDGKKAKKKVTLRFSQSFRGLRKSGSVRSMSRMKSIKQLRKRVDQQAMGRRDEGPSRLAGIVEEERSPSPLSDKFFSEEQQGPRATSENDMLLEIGAVVQAVDPNPAKVITTEAVMLQTGPSLETGLGYGSEITDDEEDEEVEDANIVDRHIPGIRTRPGVVPGKGGSGLRRSAVVRDRWSPSPSPRSRASTDSVRGNLGGARATSPFASAVAQNAPLEGFLPANGARRGVTESKESTTESKRDGLGKSEQKSPRVTTPKAVEKMSQATKSPSPPKSEEAAMESNINGVYGLNKENGGCDKDDARWGFKEEMPVGASGVAGICKGMNEGQRNMKELSRMRESVGSNQVENVQNVLLKAESGDQNKNEDDEIDDGAVPPMVQMSLDRWPSVDERGKGGRSVTGNQKELTYENGKVYESSDGDLRLTQAASMNSSTGSERLPPVHRRKESDLPHLLHQSSHVGESVLRRVAEMSQLTQATSVTSSNCSGKVRPVAMRADSDVPQLLQQSSNIRESTIRRVAEESVEGKVSQEAKLQEGVVASGLHRRNTSIASSEKACGEGGVGGEGLVGDKIPKGNEYLEALGDDLKGAQRDREITVPYVHSNARSKSFSDKNLPNGGRRKAGGFWWELGTGFVAGVLTAVWFAMAGRCDVCPPDMDDNFEIEG